MTIPAIGDNRIRGDKGAQREGLSSAGVVVEEAAGSVAPSGR